MLLTLRGAAFAIVEGKDLEFIVHLDKPTEVSKSDLRFLIQSCHENAPCRRSCRRSIC